MKSEHRAEVGAGNVLRFISIQVTIQVTWDEGGFKLGTLPEVPPVRARRSSRAEKERGEKRQLEIGKRKDSRGGRKKRLKKYEAIWKRLESGIQRIPRKE